MNRLASILRRFHKGSSQGELVGVFLNVQHEIAGASMSFGSSPGL